MRRQRRAFVLLCTMAKLIPFPRDTQRPQSTEPPAPPAERIAATRGERLYHALVFAFLFLLSLPLIACLMWAFWIFVMAPLLR